MSLEGEALNEVHLRFVVREFMADLFAIKKIPDLAGIFLKLKRW